MDPPKGLGMDNGAIEDGHGVLIVINIHSGPYSIPYIGFMSCGPTSNIDGSSFGSLLLFWPTGELQTCLASLFGPCKKRWNKLFPDGWRTQ